jgi:MoCo/4Fe-4S cofactor protein with predicted Tat translocation signal
MSPINRPTGNNGREYWRSLDQLSQTGEFKEFLNREFPQGASELEQVENNDWSRRNFITLMGASLALAGLTSCRRPETHVLPYVKAPEEIIPGIPIHYATVMPFGTGAYGVVVETHEGRPTKIEGNELHPSTRGSSNAWIQASILNLYDPDRSRRVIQGAAEKTWSDFTAYWRGELTKYQANRGAGLAVIAEQHNSPTFARLIRQFKSSFPSATFVTWEPAGDEQRIEGARIATGKIAQPVYDLAKASVIVSLDCDFVYGETESVTNARGFADGRRLKSENESMNRLYVVESAFTSTGATADHRVCLQARRIGAFAVQLAQALKKLGMAIPSIDGLSPVDLADIDSKWVAEIAKELVAYRGRSVVMAGRRLPAAVHALVCAINAALENVGNTVSWHAAPDASVTSTSDFAALVAAMKGGSISALVVLGGNPVYSAPVDLAFSEAYKKVGVTIQLGTHVDETAEMSTWHIPQSHYMEAWGDARSVDGTLSAIQPLIEPLYHSKSDIEMLGFIASGTDARGYDIVRETWGASIFALDFESKWRRALHDGVVADSRMTADPAIINSVAVANALRVIDIPTDKLSSSSMEIVFSVSGATFDGRWSNNGWLQEAPDPITKLTWDNAAIMSVGTAEVLGFSSGDIAKANYAGRSIDLPVWIVPGNADNSVTVALGYGRRSAGSVGTNVGFDVNAIRTSNAPYFDAGLTLAKTGRTYLFSTTQDHGSMEGRPIIREATYEEYRKDPNFAPEMVEHPPLESMWNEHKYDTGYQWGMVIDLNACVGCNTCTVACQSENNIPIVGKEQVRKGREMHWIRLDRYFAGSPDEPSVMHQPMACHHCELAPCEQVCPVAATVHDHEGLNVMVYNRCIGTKYCANNCPYKVRRFNFWNYTKDYPETIKMAQNPDVTVRSRGVMEKCTYCVQRISEGRITAKKENREIRDGEVRSACQQACPTGAIVFGNIRDTTSAVSQAKKINRNYVVLSELNTKPRTSFLARVRNPNPVLEGVSCGRG